jgi:hypothetical protein
LHLCVPSVPGGHAQGTRSSRSLPTATIWRNRDVARVERAGLSTLNEGQHIEYEIEENRGKTSAVKSQGQVTFREFRGIAAVTQ